LIFLNHEKIIARKNIRVHRIGVAIIWAPMDLMTVSLEDVSLELEGADDEVPTKLVVLLEDAAAEINRQKFRW